MYAHSRTVFMHMASFFIVITFFCPFHCSNCFISEFSHKEERQSLQAFSSG